MRAAKTSPAKRKETIMKLRNMSATVDYVDSITLRLEDGENIHLENAYVLTSYASRVAIYCKMRVYLLPRYDYSVTTWKHIHAFIEDYCSFVRDYDAKTMREIASNGVTDTECEYAFASGIVTGVEPEYCKCEGCVNYPCVGVCGLTEHIERY